MRHHPQLRQHSPIDSNFLGVPLFNAMFHVANQSTASIAAMINGDIVLYDDFLQSLHKVARSFEHFLMVAARYDVDRLPDDRASLAEVRKHVWKHGTLHTFGGMDVWAWNTNGPRLFDPIMPHFAYGRGKYDNWFTHETIVARRRHVVDATDVVLAAHPRDVVPADDRITQQQQQGRKQQQQEEAQQAPPSKTSSTSFGSSSISRGEVKSPAALATDWSTGKKSKFELFINIYLSQRHGTYRNQLGSVLHAPWKLVRCYDTSGRCLIKRLRPGICLCEPAAFAGATQTDPFVPAGSRVVQCGLTSTESKQEFEIPVRVRRHTSSSRSKAGPDSSATEQHPFGMPLTMASVLERVARDGVVMVTGVNFAYRHFLMNWVCNVRRLGISNFAIVAFDEALYRFAFVRGLPVYMFDDEQSMSDDDALEWGGGDRAGDLMVSTGTSKSHNSVESIGDIEYGSAQFKALTKLKSRSVLGVLRAGYDVLWSDVDVILFRNPFDTLLGLTTGSSNNAFDIFIQSNAADGENANARRRLNSGFYLARANTRTVAAFEAIVSYARRSDMTEQPCFYDVLCGRHGETALDTNKCSHAESGANVVTLDRRRFANGRTLGIWNVSHGGATGREERSGEGVRMFEEEFPELVALHNNWVTGVGKLERLRLHNLMFHDGELGLCVYRQQ